MSFWIKLMVVHYLICLNRGVQRPISYSWQLASANAAWIIASDNCGRNLHHLHPNSLLNARLRGCLSGRKICTQHPSTLFHSQPMLLRSVCISACSADQWAAFRLVFGETLWMTSIPFYQFFFSEVLNGKNCGWVKASRDVTIWGLHSLRSISSCFTSHFKSLYFMLNACSEPIGSRINKSTVPTSRFWGSSPNPNIACQDFGSWIEEIMIVMCLYIHIYIYIYIYIYIRTHIRDKDTYQRERGERGS